MQPIPGQSSRRGLCARDRRLRIIGQVRQHHWRDPVKSPRVRGVHALTWGAELPRLEQHSRRARAVARVQISRANVPQQAPAGRWPARGDTREHEAEHPAPRGVHARAWRPQLPRPQDPQSWPARDRAAAGHQHRRPRVHPGGSRVRGPMTSSGRCWFRIGIVEALALMPCGTQLGSGCHPDLSQAAASTPWER